MSYSINIIENSVDLDHPLFSIKFISGFILFSRVYTCVLFRHI